MKVSSTSSDQASARERFIEFVEEFYRRTDTHLGHFDWDGESPIAFEARIDEVKFQVGYDPLAAGNAHLFVYCPFGPMPPHEDASMLRRLLELNLALGREHNASYCVDVATREVAFYLRRDLAQVDMTTLFEEMAGVAEDARRWKEGVLPDAPPAAGPSRLPDAWWGRA